MPAIIEITVYRFDELPEAGKDNARAWYTPRGGKPPDGTAAWQLQQVIGAAVRANRAEITVDSAPRGGKRFVGGATWQAQRHRQSSHSCKMQRVVLWLSKITAQISLRY